MLLLAVIPLSHAQVTTWTGDSSRNFNNSSNEVIFCANTRFHGSNSTF